MEEKSYQSVLPGETGFLGSEITLYDTIIVNAILLLICQYP